MREEKEDEEGARQRKKLVGVGKEGNAAATTASTSSRVWRRLNTLLLIYY